MFKIRLIALFGIVIMAACAGVQAQSVGLASLTPGVVTSFAGGGTGCTANKTGPYDGCAPNQINIGNLHALIFDSSGNLYIADGANHRVRKITPSGTVSTVAGNGTYSNTVGVVGAAIGDNGPATAASVNQPASLAVDSYGNLYIGDYAYALVRVVYEGGSTLANLILLTNPTLTSVTPGYIYTIAGNGTYPVITGLTGAAYGAALGDGGLATNAAFDNSTNLSSSNGMNGITVDSSGNVYVADGVNDAIRKITASAGIISFFAGDYGVSGSPTNGTPANAGTSASAIGDQRGITSDAAGDIFLVSGVILMINGPNTTATTPGLGFGYAPGTFHIIAGGNGGTSGYAGPYNTLGTLTRFSSPRQITIDPAGDLYNNDNGYDRITKLDVNDIVTLVAGNSAQTGPTFTASDPPTGLGGPATSAGLGAATSAAISPLTGDLYVIDNTNALVYDVSASSSILAFGNQSTYVASAMQTAIVSNVGAGALQLSGLSFSSTAQFSQVYSGSTDCTSSTLLQPGQSCKIAVVFTPNAIGAATATITITDNSMGTAGTAQTITLTGTGTTTATSTTLTATPTTASANAPVVLTATVAAIGVSGAPAVAPSGQVTFYNGSTALTPTATLSANGMATLSTTLTAGSYTNLTASYPGNSVYLASTSAAASVTVLSTAATTTSLSVSSQTILSGGSVTFTANVNSASGTPTGTVTFYSGVTALSPTETLTGGVATYTTTALAAGCSAITAVYQGTATYTMSASAVSVVCVNANDLPVGEMIPGIISTFAGTPGTSGNTGDNGVASAALLNGPTREAFDPSGNLYIADSANNTIRKIAATSGVITSSSTITVLSGAEGVAGAAVGNATTAARYQSPQGIAFDSSGNLYIADSLNNAIRKIAASSGSISSASTVSSFAGSQVGLGTYTGAAFAAGYTGDGGQALNATLNDPRDVAVDKLGNVFIADYGNNVVRMVNGANTTPATPGFGFGYASGVIHTVAGSGRITSGVYPNGDGGLATYATFGSITGIATDLNGNLYISDAGNNVVRVVSVATGIINTYAGQEGIQGYAGDGGPAKAAKLTSPAGLSFDVAGNLYIADSGYSVVREVTPAGNILTVAGTGVSGSLGDNGPSTSAKLTKPVHAVPDGRGNIYIVDSALDTVRQINGQASAVTFAELADGVNSPPMTVTINNPGGQTLTLSGLAFSSTVFTQTTSGTGNCASTSVLNPGVSCAISIVANSSTQGTETGTLTVTDNSLNTASSQQIAQLSVQTIPVPTQTINWTQTVGPYIYGQTPVTLTASATSGLPITYTITSSSPANIASITGSTLIISGAGSFTVAASQPGMNLQFLPATTMSKTVVVNPALLTVTAQNVNESTGIPIVLPTPSYVITGFQLSDTQATVTTGSPTVTPTCTSSSPSGTFPINVTQGTLATTTSNYLINASSFVSGVCTLAGLPNVITWPALSPNPVLYSATSYTVTPATASSGLAVTYSVISGPGSIVAGSNQLTLKGSGSILIAANQAGNYNATTNPNGYGVAVPLYQTLNVTQAPLTVSANNATRTYGTPNPTFASTITGAVTPDTFVVSYATSPASTVTSPPGSYVIQPSVTGGSNVSSYSISYNSGTLTITQAMPSITIASTYTSFGYGTSDPLTATLSTAGGQGVLPTGTVSFYAGTYLIGTATVNSSGVASLSTGSATPIPAGLQSVTAVYGGDTNYSTLTSSAISLAVKANTTTSIASSAINANQGATVTFTATVVPAVASNQVPTGMVTFAYTAPGASTAIPLTTVAVSPVSGVATATLPVSILPIGTNVVTALYTPGDNFFYASSAVGSLNEIIAQEFTLVVPLTGTTANTVTIKSGQTAQLQGTVTGNNGFVQPISLTCTGLPANATCMFSQSKVVPTALGVQFNILISTTAVNEHTLREDVPNPSNGRRGGIAFAGVLFGLAGLWARRRTTHKLSSRARLLLLLVIAFVGFSSLSGCGENGPYSPIPQGTSQITVTGTSGSVSYSDTFTLVVQ